MIAWLSAAALHGTVPRDPSAPGAPSLPVLALLSVGRPSTGASMAWCGTVLHHANAPEPDAQTVLSGISASIALDPSFRPPTTHGALLLRRLGRPDLAEQVLQAGSRQFPRDPWFPWARAMIAWVDRGDRSTAAAWMQQAAELTCPGCPSEATLHGRAAASLRGSAP